MKKIIIFGATGETGIYLTDYIFERLKDTYEIIAVGSRKTNYFDKFPLKYYDVDISKKCDFEKLPVEDVFAVIHLAGILPARMKGYEPQKYIDINITGSLNVLEYCKDVHADRFLYTKTVADLYGHLGKLGEVNYLSADLPRSFRYSGDHCIYALSKSIVGDFSEYYHQTYGIKNFVFRLCNIYLYSPNKYYYVNGEQQYISYRYLIDRAISGQEIEVWGNPNKGRDMIYVKDFCQILYKALLTDCDGGEFNVGTGQLTSIDKMVKTIIDVFSGAKKSEIVYKPEKRDAVNVVMDISKTVDLLGYKPEYDLRKFLEDYKIEMNGNRFENL